MRVQVPLSPTPKSPFSIYLFYPIFYFLLVVQSSLCFSFILFFSILQAYPSGILFSYHKSCDILWYIWYKYKSTSILEQGIPIWMIHNPYHYSYWNLQSLFFWRSKKFPFETFNTFSFFLFSFLIDIDRSHLVLWG